MIIPHELIVIDGDNFTKELLICFLNRDRVRDQAICLAAKESFNLLADIQIHSLKPKFIVFNYQSCILDLKKNLEHIRKKFPHIRFIAYSFSGNSFEIELLLKAGVRALLSKQHSLANVLDAMDALTTDEYYLNDLVGSAVLSKVQRTMHIVDNGLSLSEIAIIRLLSIGLSREYIGQLFYREKHTIENEISIIHSKTGTKNDWQIMRYAILNGYLHPTLIHEAAVASHINTWEGNEMRMAVDR